MDQNLKNVLSTKSLNIGAITSSLALGTMLCEFFELLPGWISGILIFMTGLLVMIIILGLEWKLDQLFENERNPNEGSFALNDRRNRVDVNYNVGQILFLVKGLDSTELEYFNQRLKDEGLIR